MFQSDVDRQYFKAALMSTCSLKVFPLLLITGAYYIPVQISLLRTLPVNGVVWPFPGWPHLRTLQKSSAL